MKEMKVWGVSDNGFVRLYDSEKKAREEYLAIVKSVKENKYFHPSAHRDVKLEIEVDDYDTHYIVYTANGGVYDHDEYRQAWYQKMKIN